jgi:type IV pilus assembly protein PilM
MKLPGILASRPPSVGVEIASDRVTGVLLAGAPSAWTVGAHATERLPAGAVTPALNAVNIHDERTVTAALRSVFERLGTKPRRVGLVIPDTSAKVSLLRFEKVPAASDLDQLIRWQVRKAAPFKPEEAQISWVSAARLSDGGREFLVTLARRDIVESYERVCAEAGADAGVVDLASLNLINAALASSGQASGGDWLIVNVAQDYATLAIVRGADLIFFRTRQLEAEGDLADLVHQTSMYHEDRLSGGRFARVVLSGASGRGIDSGERLRRGLEERLGTRVEPLDFRATATMRDRINAGTELLDTLAPAVGIVLRERVA